MARVYKILGQSNPAATTETNLYTVPGSTESVLSTLTICNTASAAATYRISAVPSGDSASNKHFIAFDASISGNDTIALTLGLTLSSSGSLNVFASSASVAFGAFGSEIS